VQLWDPGHSGVRTRCRGEVEAVREERSAGTDLGGLKVFWEAREQRGTRGSKQGGPRTRLGGRWEAGSAERRSLSRSGDRGVGASFKRSGPAGRFEGGERGRRRWWQRGVRAVRGSVGSVLCGNRVRSGWERGREGRGGRPASQVFVGLCRSQEQRGRPSLKPRQASAPPPNRSTLGPPPPPPSKALRSNTAGPADRTR